MDRLALLADNMREPVSAVVSGKPMLKMTLERGLTPSERGTMLSRFEEYANWTIPALFPKTNAGTEDLGFDLQSLGAQLTLNLVSKMMLVMFNPSQPFFKAELNEEEYAVLMNGGQKTKQDVDAQMASVEKNAIRQFETEGGRVAAMHAVILAAVTGNALFEQRDDGNGKKYRTFSYRDYDAKFDVWGKVTDIVYREAIVVGQLPKDLMMLMVNQYGRNTDDVVELYTGCRLINGKYLVWQEIEDLHVLTERFGIYEPDDLPYSVVRWSVAPGRQAGVGLTELMAGDWHVFSALAETDVDLIALMTDILTLVDTQAGGIKLRDVQNAEVGGYVPGKKDALTSHSHNIQGKLQDVDYKTQQVIRRLSQMYLMTGNVIRNSERTTAEEVRIVTQEIGQVHLSTYLMFGDTLQKPIATHKLRQALPALRSIKPTVLTGVTDMTRAAELDAHRGMWNDLIMLGNIPPHIAVTMKMEEEVKVVAAGWGVDMSAAMRTAEEIRAEQERQAMLNSPQQGTNV